MVFLYHSHIKNFDYFYITVIPNILIKIKNVLPIQEWPVCDIMNPGLQRHWKDPCMFKHFPFAHMPFFSHSSWSNRKATESVKKSFKILSVYILITYTTFSIRSQIVSWRTRTYKTSWSIVTLSVVANSLLWAFVDV